MVPVRKFSARRRLIIWLEVTPGSDPVSMLPAMSKYPSCCILLTVLGTSPVRPLAKPSCKASTLSEHRDPQDTDSEWLKSITSGCLREVRCALAPLWS